MTAKQTGRMACVVLLAMVVYAVWNTAVVRHRLVRAEAYRVALTEQTQTVSAENERLRREIAQAEDAAVIERVARTQLGLVKPGEIIFCGIREDAKERESNESGG